MCCGRHTEYPDTPRKEKKKNLNACRRKEILFIEGISQDKPARAVLALIPLYQDVEAKQR